MVSVSSPLPRGDQFDQADIQAWLHSLVPARGADDIVYLRRVIEYAQQVHGDAREPGGEPTVLHILHVADILNGLKLDRETLAAAILHDTTREPGFDPPDIRNRFGDIVCGLLESLARIGGLASVARAVREESLAQHQENLRRMLLGIADDVRVVLIVLAERLHDLRCAKHLPEQARTGIAQETLQLHAPLANRLGVWQMKWEMEDLCLRYLEPEAYAQIAGQLDGRRREREGFLEDVIATLRREFAKLDIHADVSGRPKHIYSIWRKMQRKAVDFDRIFDVRAVRVLVDTVAECYAALGVVHGLWRHIPGEFDDYIATPKANMYRSLHTAVIGSDDKPLEVQIRTHDMHEHAERGVAAHWAYKESRQQDAEMERRIAWMRRWLELKDSAESDAEFVEHFKEEFQPALIYVLTPNGEVIELPQGATPLDFAYAIHTSVGHRCRGAKVDGRIVQLTQPLQSGQTVEILTAKQGGPSRDWLSPHLGYLHTARARNRIRQWFKHQDFAVHVSDGRAVLDREVQRLGVARPNLENIAARFNLQGGDELLAAIGRGDVSPVQVAGLGGGGKPQAAPASEKKRRKPVKKALARKAGEVMVQGVGDLMTHMARCCKPVPGDAIVGYITRGRGVTVHRAGCAVIRKMDAAQRERQVEVVWSDAGAAGAYTVDVQVYAIDRKGLLRDVSSIFSDEEVDVVGVKTHSDRRKERASMRFTLEVGDMRQLSRVMDKLAQLPDIIDVRRAV